MAHVSSKQGQREWSLADDLLIRGTDVERFDQFDADMQVLELKDLGIVEKFLGMRIMWTAEGGYYIDQEQTIDEVLEKRGLSETTPGLNI